LVFSALWIIEPATCLKLSRLKVELKHFSV
jgi:hypothetical protein